MGAKKSLLLVSLIFLGYEAIVIATPYLPPYLDVLSWFLLFTLLAGFGYFMLGFLSKSWYSLIVALAPLVVLFGIDFDGPFAGYSDPEATVAPMREAWVWLTIIVFLPLLGLGAVVSKVSAKSNRTNQVRT